MPENFDGSIRKLVIGSEYTLHPYTFKSVRAGRITLDDYPLSEVWREFIADNDLTGIVLIELDFFLTFFMSNRMEFETRIEELINRIFPSEKYRDIASSLKKLTYLHHITAIIQAMKYELSQIERFAIYRDAALDIFYQIPKDKFVLSNNVKAEYYHGSLSNQFISDHRFFKYWRDALKAAVYDDHSFREYFTICYMYYRETKYKSAQCLSLSDFARAYKSGIIDENEMFSHLLKACYPAEEDNAGKLKDLLMGKKIPDKRLLEAAMYSPQWIDIVEQYLRWPGLSMTCWYFHAHVNELFNNDKETIVARYSPISKHAFKDGAFDIDWFWKAYKTIGEKRFNMVYDSARYISEGSKHKRSQLFADAVLGKLNAVDIEKEVSEKRNKDRLLAYSLIPLEKNGEALTRYEFIQRFIKESRQFGAQRRASEGKAAEIAL